MKLLPSCCCHDDVHAVMMHDATHHEAAADPQGVRQAPDALPHHLQQRSAGVGL